MKLRQVFRPIVTWPGKLTTKHENCRFESSYTQTVRELESEIAKIAKPRTSEYVIQIACGERAFRNDGGLRADAKAEHPGVIVSFESIYGPLQYATDVFDKSSRWQNGSTVYSQGWQNNLRAIAKSLEALRMVDRYGVSRRGEQYTGWKQLGSGIAMPAAMNETTAIKILADGAGVGPWVPPFGVADVHHAFKLAAKTHHPDRGGDEATFKRLVEARDFLLGVR